MMRPTLTKLAAACALLGLPAAAQADPLTLAATFLTSTVGAAAASTILGLVTTYGGYALLGLQIYGGIDARRRAKAAQRDATRRYNASVADRSVSLLQATPPWRIVYGECITGGSVVAIFTSDKTTVGTNGAASIKPDGLKHMVILMASHEVDALGDLFIDGVPLGALDGSGYATGSDWTTGTAEKLVTVTFSGSTTLTAAATAIVSATTSGVNEGGPWDIERTVAISGGGLTLTVTDGLDAGSVTVVYKTSLNPSVIRVQKHLGTAGQTVDAYLTSVVPTEWDASHRLRGCAYLVVTLDLEDQRFQGGPPALTCRVRGKKLYDPRKDSTNGGSGSHRYATPSTWEWSDNPALCTRDWIVGEYGMAHDNADILDAFTIAAANACDVIITTDIGGVTAIDRTYRCNGVATTEDGRETVLDTLADSMAGFAIYGAQWQILAGAWTAPVMALTDDDLDGQIEVSQAGAGIDELLNGVRGTYIGTDSASPTDFEPYQNSTFVTADGEPLWRDVALPFTNGKHHCTNIARVLVERARNSQVIQYPAKLRAWPLQIGDRVTVTSAEYGITVPKTYRVTDWQFGLSAPVTLALQEDAADAYDLVDAVTADPTPNTNLPPPWLVEQLQLGTPQSGTDHLIRASDGTITARVWVPWLPLTGAYLQDGLGRVVVRWRRVGADADWQQVQADAADAGVYLLGVQDGDRLVIEAWAVNDGGFRGAAAVATHTVVGKTEPPADVTAFTVIEAGGFSRLFFWDYTENTPDLAGFRARYIDQALASVAWDVMPPLFEAGRLDRSVSLQAPADGEWRIGIRAYDTSGNESANARYLTVLLDQSAFGAPLLSVDAGALGWPGTKTNCDVEAYYLADAGTLTWDTIPTTWDAWADWAGPSASPISYTHTAVDVGATLTLRLREGRVASGTVLAEYQTSTDGTTYTAWAAVPTGTFSARYVRLRWTVSGDAPVLYRAHFRLYV